jgi:hypothetical protein
MNAKGNPSKEPALQEKADRKDARDGRPAYQPPRIVKKRAVSRATLFTGTGPDSGGVVG